MQQAGDGTDPQRSQYCEPLIRPSPVRPIEGIRRDALPQHGVPQRGDAESGKAFEILQAMLMAAALCLIEPLVANSIDRAFDAAPHLDRVIASSHTSHARAISRRGCPAIRAYTASACATTWSML